jgi:hypothetical protein
MKKIIPIFLTLLMLTALIHFSVATHYCGGNQVASSVSLTGKMATCGMEYNDGETHQTGLIFKSHCCDNVVSFFGITNSFFPTYSFVPELFQHNFQLFDVPVLTSYCLSESNNLTFTSVSPPGAFASESVDLTSICVFRI